MTKRLLWKSALLILAAGTTLSMGACLDTTVQRVLVAVGVN